MIWRLNSSTLSRPVLVLYLLGSKFFLTYFYSRMFLLHVCFWSRSLDGSDAMKINNTRKNLIDTYNPFVYDCKSLKCTYFVVSDSDVEQYLPYISGVAGMLTVAH